MAGGGGDDVGSGAAPASSGGGGETAISRACGFRLEQRALPQAQTVEPVLAHRLERLDAVLGATAEVDLAGLVEVPHRHRHVAQAEPEVDRLHQELRVEDEVVAVALEGNRFENLAAVDAEAAVELAEVLPEHEVLERRQAAVADVLPPRHAALERLGPAAHPVA